MRIDFEMVLAGVAFQIQDLTPDDSHPVVLHPDIRF